MNTILSRLVGPWLALAALLGSLALPEQCQAASSRYEARLDATGGDRIAYDWSRFPRDLWMGDYYLWLNGPGGRAEQTTALLARPGELCQLTAEVGYSLDIWDGKMSWPGGRLVLLTTGPGGPREEAAAELPSFTAADAGTFKHVALTWRVPANAQGRAVGVRLESRGPQIAWDNVRLGAR
jgi:hypothetical protein